jgi:hypothetical protein
VAVAAIRLAPITSMVIESISRLCMLLLSDLNRPVTIPDRDACVYRVDVLDGRAEDR